MHIFSDNEDKGNRIGCEDVSGATKKEMRAHTHTKVINFIDTVCAVLYVFWISVPSTQNAALQTYS